MAINPIKALKVVGTIMGVSSTLILSFVSDKENAKTIEKLINDKLSNK